MPFSFSHIHPTLFPLPLHPGTAHSLPLLLLRLEGATLFGATVYLYHRLQRWHRSSLTSVSSPVDGSGRTGALKKEAKDPLSWTRFAVLILVPDLGMVGFLRDARWGSWIYNVVHSETLPLLLVTTLLSDVLDVRSITGGAKKADEATEGEGQGRMLGLRKGTWAKWMGVGLVWLGHIGMDRMCGFGLKYEAGFGVTHLGVMS